MSTEDFVVRIADLDAGPQRVRQPIGPEWLSRALADTDGEPWPPPEPGQVGEVDLQVAKNGRQILVRGRIRARVTLPCARTLDPAHYELEPEVFLLLEPGPEEAAPGRARARSERTETAGRGRRGDRGADKTEPGKGDRTGKPARETSAASKKGKRRGEWSEDPELTEEVAATDTYSGELLHLDGFIREFIVLEFPMFPLREDLRSDAARASSALPFGPGASPGVSDAGPSGARINGAGATQLDDDRPLDPRLSPLAELKARLEKKE